MRYLLDTNVWIHFLKGHRLIEARLRGTPVSAITVCSIVWAELRHGARKYGNPIEREALVVRTLSPYESLPFDDEAAQRYGHIRHTLERSGQVIGPHDLLIASIATAHHLTLVTANHEFSRIEKLKSEDWSKP